MPHPITGHTEKEKARVEGWKLFGEPVNECDTWWPRTSPPSMPGPWPAFAMPSLRVMQAAADLLLPTLPRAGQPASWLVVLDCRWSWLPGLSPSGWPD